MYAPTQICSITSESPQHTTAIAADLASLLHGGDCIALDGPVGAGKTHFARAMIQSLQDSAEDVPSPTFTLVQTYKTRAGEIWHADLYRLSASEEIEELGLRDALEEAICLIEWPDRMGDTMPKDHLRIEFRPKKNEVDERDILFLADDPKWADRLKDVCQ